MVNRWSGCSKIKEVFIGLNDFILNEELTEEEEQMVKDAHIKGVLVGSDIATIFLKINGQLLPFETGSDGQFCIYATNAEGRKALEGLPSYSLQREHLLFMTYKSSLFAPLTNKTAGLEVYYAPYDCEGKLVKMDLSEFMFAGASCLEVWLINRPKYGVWGVLLEVS